MRKQKLGFAMAALVGLLAGCGGGSGSEGTGGTSTTAEATGGSATGSLCDEMPPKKIAEVSGYPVRHLYAPDSSLGGLDCYYTVEKRDPAAADRPYPLVRLWMPKSVEIEITCRAAENTGDSRCQNPAGVGDQAKLESDWQQDQETFEDTDIRESSLLVGAGGKWFAAFIEARESATKDVSREQALMKIAALLRDTYEKGK